MSLIRRLAIAFIGAVALLGSLFIGTTAGAATHKPSASCVTALKAFKQIMKLAGQGFEVAGNYPSQYGPIAQAIQDDSTSEVDAITSKVKGWNNQLGLLSSGLNMQESIAVPAANKCLAGH
jgi:hypothetical protein